MASRNRMGSIVVPVLILLYGNAGAQDRVTVAVVSKVVQDVSRMVASTTDWTRARPGEILAGGDRLKTGQSSFAVVKFKDNSMVRVRELSEVSIQASKEKSLRGAALVREVVGFDISKQRAGEEFQFSAPLSVASIRGTSGQIVVADTADMYVVTNGLVIVTTPATGLSVEVGKGVTAIAALGGSLVTRPSTAEEIKAAEAASRVDEKDNSFEFDLRDSQGNRKKLKIEFKQ